LRKTILAVLVIVATIASLLAAAPIAQAGGPVRVVRWVDGDTVVTNQGTVRLIGVDTPERGRCGYAAAARLATQIAPNGSIIGLGNPKSVMTATATVGCCATSTVAKRDMSAVQINHGAWARYDSRDGYQRHPRQAKYHRVDAAHRNYCGLKNPSATPKSGPKPSTGGQVSGPVGPAGKSCPSSAPIKGNQDFMIYHRPGQQYYAATTPEECFRDGAWAEAAGYRPAKI